MEVFKLADCRIND